MRIALLSLVALVNVGGCSLLYSAPPPKLPISSSVARLDFHSGTRSVSDAAQISVFLQTIGRYRSDWHYVFDTYPSASERVFLIAPSGEALCFIDIGQNFVGSNCGQEKGGWPPLTVVDPEEVKMILRVLDSTRLN